MPLGTIDFSQVKDFTPVPAGRYAGQTEGGWEQKEAKDKESINIIVKYKFEHEDEQGEPEQRTHTQYYNLKPKALWSLKRDLVSLGADPAALEGNSVDLEAVLNEIFDGTPKPVWLHFKMSSFTPAGASEAVPSNELTKVELREA